MKVTHQITFVLALVVFFCAVSADMHDGMMHYASLKSSDGTSFELQWAYNNDTDMLYFAMKCKNTGWCGVGFSTTGTGAGMKDYDIAVGGYNNSNIPYLFDYWSTAKRQPSKDSQQNLTIQSASQMGEYTMVNFTRPANTTDMMKDVQFTPDTEVWVMYAMHSTDVDGHGVTFSRHSKKGRISDIDKYNLIKMALAADGHGHSDGSSASTNIFSGTCAVASALLYLVAHIVLSF
ncbi:DBH-like monooxygenase protein 1 isoform X1 [Montipora foliosa]|uniref:DBH-like monooxygenase protein 1 isoform X1 n=1 Tax=Montipora foliosa TaxID=591990 RepID=UPI0035F1C5DA